MWVNFHTHNALPLGVVGIINIDNPQMVLCDNAFYSIGLHPWNLVDSDSGITFDKVSLLAENKLIKCIGECGFDKHRGIQSLQDKLFLQHIELSEKLKKPLIIHSVGGSNRILEYKRAIKPSQPWIIHSFIGNIQLATSFANYGIYCSFSISSLKHKKTIEVFKQYPPSLSFVETDDQIVSIEEVYFLAASVQEINVSTLKELYHSNFKRLFKLND